MILRFSQFYLLAAAILAALLWTGCATSRPGPSEASSGISQLPESWKPQLLYLLSSPHSRLYVELDAVQGCEPTESEVQGIRDFLSKYCDKPDGIEIVRSDVIPLSSARGLSESVLARRHLQGPGVSTGRPAAYLYILFYDDRLCGNPPTDPPAGAANSRNPARRPEAKKPRAEVFPYPAIYFNSRYFWLRRTHKSALAHEAGHILGLAQRPTAREGHCPNESCLMNYGLSLPRFLLGQQRRLCARCASELSGYSRLNPRSNLHFAGGVAVRSEPHYLVLTLPDRVRVIPGGLSEEKCRAFADEVRAEASAADDFRVDFRIEEDLLGDPSKIRALASDLKTDCLELLRTAGPNTLLKACASRFDAMGQYSNAVDLLHLAVRENARDAESQNQLAWLRATCPDSSVRNGPEAVSAATAACEATEWKDWQAVDTLAAAYAESGNFTRAIELQQRALAMAGPGESDRKELEEHLSLFKQSKPLRTDRKAAARP